jgi:tryptophan halogenase
MKKYKFVIVGGGTAGMITAAYFSKKWGEQVEVTVIYDHKNPGIGVGESLTPNIYSFLEYVGITREDMIRNVNATVKLGLKFKNWLNDGNYYYHNFSHMSENSSNKNTDSIGIVPLIAAYDIVHGIYDSDFCYGKDFMESSRISLDTPQALHIDATLFSKFIEQKFKNKITVLDGKVEEVINNGEIIRSVLLEDGRLIEGDFFVDSTGFQSILFKKITSEWIDKTDWLPLDRCIPNPLPWEFKEQPVYTTSEASDQGWILQVPLSNRWGTGYLYSSNFIKDEDAFRNFEQFLNKNYGENTLNNKSKVLNFKSGYWKKQWVGNCIAVGLSSGFAEPLEATNIHHVIDQVRMFTAVFNFKILKHDVENYNKIVEELYLNTYLYLRFCYTTNRTDSEFWKYMTNSVPYEVKNLEEKIKTDILTNQINSTPFNFRNFIKVAHGLKKIDIESWKNQLKNKKLMEHGRNYSTSLKKDKLVGFEKSVDHLYYINSVLSRK